MPALMLVTKLRHSSAAKTSFGPFRSLESCTAAAVPTKTGLPRVDLRLSSDRAHVRIEVWDQDPHIPVSKAASPDDESGRGLMLVATLSERWGCDTTPGQNGKMVWAELPVV